MGRGIDTAEEREVFTYKPDIQHQVDFIRTPGVDEAELDDEANREDNEIQDYVNGLLSIDDAFDNLFDILEKQQKNLLLEIDPDRFPQVADAIACLSGGEQNTKIDYDIYRKASHIINERMVNQVFTDHPVRGIPDVDELRSRRDRQDKNIAEKIFNLAVRMLGAEIIRAVAKSLDGKVGVSGFSVGSGIAKLLRRLANKMAGAKFNVNELNAATDFSDAVIDLDDTGENDHFVDGRNLNDDVADIGDTALFECASHAQTVDNYIIDAAIDDKLNNEVNPAAFLERRQIEVTRIAHEQTKEVVKSGISNLWRTRSDLDELKKRIDENGWLNVNAWLGPDVETLRIETYKAARPFNDSFAVKSLKDYGYKRLLETLNAMSNDLAQWFTDPVVLCCFIQSAIVAVKIDRSIIETLRIALVFRKDQMQRNIDGVLRSGSNMINDIIQGLIARLIVSLDIAISGYIGKFRRAAQGRLNLTGCIPWDRFVGEIFYTLAAMEDDLLAMLSQYTGKLKVGELRLFQQHQMVKEQQRANFLLKLFNVLLELLELEQICVEGDEAVKFDRKADFTRLTPTPNILEGFVGSPGSGPTLTPDDVITIFDNMGINLDPSVFFDDQKLDPSKHSIDSYGQQAFLDKCGDALNAENVREISESLRGFGIPTTRRS